MKRIYLVAQEDLKPTLNVVIGRVGKGQSASRRSRKKRVLSLLRRLGLGLLTVAPKGNVVPTLDPPSGASLAESLKRKDGMQA